MKTHDDPARAEQTAAMLDHLLAHYETFCEGRPAGRIPESFMAELHELYYWRTGCTDTATAWQAPLPPMQDGDPGDNWYDRHIGPYLWRLTDRVHWRRLRGYFIFHGLMCYSRLFLARQRLHLVYLRTVALLPPAQLLALAALWPLLWLLAHGGH